MEIKGKLEQDAVAITTCENGGRLLKFSIAVVNGITAPRENGTQVSCSFYCNMRYMLYLKKGVLVKLSGILGVRGFTVDDGKIVTQLTFRVQRLKLFTNPHKILPAPVDIPSGALPVPSLPIFVNN